MSRYRSNRLPAASGHAVGIEEAVNDFLLHHQRKGDSSLRRIVAESCYRGEWRGPEDSRFQFRAESGAVLNSWATTKTLQFQGPQDEEARLRAAFVSTATRLAASYVERLSSIPDPGEMLSGQTSS